MSIEGPENPVSEDATFTVTLSASRRGFTLGTATVPPSRPTARRPIEGPENPVSEDDDATFTVTLSASPGAEVVVDYATAAGTATTDDDFTETSGTLTFPANTTTLTQTFDVKVLPDDQVEGNETFTATLSANSSLPTGITLGTATATATITGAGMATVSIEGPEKPVAEGDNATFTVTLSGGLPTEAVTVDYATAAVTAMETDFTLTAGTLSFAAGATGDDLTQTFNVKVLPMFWSKATKPSPQP